MRKSARLIWFIGMCWGLGLSPVLADSRLNPDVHHFVSVYGELGYAGWLHNAKGINTLSGVTPSVGLGYRYMRAHFILQTGVEMQYMWLKGVMPGYTQTKTMIDADNPQGEFQMTASLYNHTDVNSMINFNIPFTLGYEKGRFYTLAGVKAGVSVTRYASSTATLTTTAEYQHLIGPFEEMDQFGLGTSQIKSDPTIGSLPKKLNLSVHFEIGARLDHFQKHKIFRLHNNLYRMYLGVFADCGVLNLHTDKAIGELSSVEFGHGVKADIVPLILSNQMNGKNIYPLTVGVRYTVLLEVPIPGKSYVYDYDEVERNYRKRGGNQTINQ